jgi:hypothetical protein
MAIVSSSSDDMSVLVLLHMHSLVVLLHFLSNCCQQLTRTVFISLYIKWNSSVRCLLGLYDSNHKFMSYMPYICCNAIMSILYGCFLRVRSFGSEHEQQRRQTTVEPRLFWYFNESFSNIFRGKAVFPM